MPQKTTNTKSASNCKARKSVRNAPTIMNCQKKKNKRSSTNGTTATPLFIDGLQNGNYFLPFSQGGRTSRSVWCRGKSRKCGPGWCRVRGRFLTSQSFSSPLRFLLLPPDFPFQSRTGRVQRRCIRPRQCRTKSSVREQCRSSLPEAALRNIRQAEFPSCKSVLPGRSNC